MGRVGGVRIDEKVTCVRFIRLYIQKLYGVKTYKDSLLKGIMEIEVYTHELVRLKP